METSISRRSFLAKTFKTGFGLMAASSVGQLFMSSCQKKDDDNTYADNQKFASMQNEAPCIDPSNLSDEEKRRRDSLKYVDQTLHPARRCDNCRVYSFPKKAGCGTCNLVPGPIHPKGHCIAWIPRM